jgi:orotidine-5'-phosphate decarboxylase
VTSPIAFALDFAALADARAAAERVRDAVGMVKVGLELFTRAGPEAARIDVGLPVFLDLKLHDIPETVERAVARVADLGVRYVTVHAQGGPTMLRRAVARAEGGLSIVAVTVLTSFDDADLAAIGVGGDIPTQAVRLATMAWSEGVRAFVCSPREVKTMRGALGPEATLITPGVRPSSRPASGGGDDQKRVATAAQAITDGADWLVVGRPIRDATDPLEAARAIAREAMAAKA